MKRKEKHEEEMSKRPKIVWTRRNIMEFESESLQYAKARYPEAQSQVPPFQERKEAAVSSIENDRVALYVRKEVDGKVVHQVVQQLDRKVASDRCELRQSVPHLCLRGKQRLTTVVLEGVEIEAAEPYINRVYVVPLERPLCSSAAGTSAPTDTRAFFSTLIHVDTTKCARKADIVPINAERDTTAGEVVNHLAKRFELAEGMAFVLCRKGAVIPSTELWFDVMAGDAHQEVDARPILRAEDPFVCVHLASDCSNRAYFLLEETPRTALDYFGVTGSHYLQNTTWRQIVD